MTESHENHNQMQNLPTELLLYIFRYLPGKKLQKCRQVCLRWKEIIDEMSANVLLWYKYCKYEFKDYYLEARRKSPATLSWAELYRNLSTWPKLNKAVESLDEFASASTSQQQISNFEIIDTGLIGVHTNASVRYYELNTLEATKTGSLNGNFFNYKENDNILVVTSTDYHLCVYRKLILNPSAKNNIMITGVKSFLLAYSQVYYVNLDDELYKIDLRQNNIKVTFLKHVNDVMCMGYKDNILYILLYDKNLYALKNTELVFKCTMNQNLNYINLLRKYNLFEMINWRIYSLWMFDQPHVTPPTWIHDITVIKSYLEMYFTGSLYGIFRIYYAPPSQEFDLFTAEPIKQYNLLERKDGIVLDHRCPILKIDVYERKGEHMVLIAIEKKIAVIRYHFDFEKPLSSAIIPYSEAIKFKLLNLNET